MQKLRGTEHTTEGPACSLAPEQLADRLARWKMLAEQALSRKEGPGWVSSTYPRSALRSLRALIEAEAECCPFLSFQVTEGLDLIEVQLRFPSEFAPLISLATGRKGKE